MKDKSVFVIVFSGMFCLAIAMGIGRFAYTPLLPLMQEREQFTSLLAGNLASINYIGYFFGAVCAGVIRKRDTRTLSIFIVVSILTTSLMGVSSNALVWMFLRFLSGISSGLIFVFASSIVIDEISKRGHARLSGILYGGVGIGIFISGVIVPFLPSAAYWNLGWYILGVICVVFLGFILLGFRGLNKEVTSSFSQNDYIDKSNKKRLKRLYLSYGCEGFGYIICATFLISMITDGEFFSWHPATAWATVGLAAIPSCVLWAKLGNQLGNIVALRYAYFLQIIGILLPIVIKHDVTAIIGALFFGATFMGITTLTITLGKQLFTGNSTKVISRLTAVYSIGQILGPTVSGLIAFVHNGYESIMALSAAVLMIAFLSLKSFSPKEEQQIALRQH